jgi:hypothetical protein
MSALEASVAMYPTLGSHAPSVEAVFTARFATDVVALHTNPTSGAIYSIDNYSVRRCEENGAIRRISSSSFRTSEGASTYGAVLQTPRAWWNTFLDTILKCKSVSGTG